MSPLLLLLSILVLGTQVFATPIDDVDAEGAEPPITYESCLKKMGTFSSARAQVLYSAGGLFRDAILPFLAPKPIQQLLRVEAFCVIYLINLPVFLARFTRCDPFNDAPLDELFDLLELREFLPDRFYQLLAQDSIFWLQSLPIVKHAASVFLNDSTLDDDAKRKCFSDLAVRLFKHEKLKELDCLISSTPGKLIYISTLDDFVSIACKLVTTYSDSAAKFVQFASSKRLDLLVASIVFASVSELMFNAVKSCLLHPKLLGELVHFKAKLKYISVEGVLQASPHDTHACKRTFALLEKLSHIAPSNESLSLLISYLRILYSLRFGSKLENARMLKAIKKLLSLANKTYTILDDIKISIMLVALDSKNDELASFLLENVDMSKFEFEILVGYSNATRLLSIPKCEELIKMHCPIRMVRLCKAAGRVYPNDEWIQTVERMSDRLAIIAEIYGFDQFRDAFHHAIRDEQWIDYESLLPHLVQLERPVPFVNVILELVDIRRHSWLFESSNFLHALLLEDEKQFTIFTSRNTHRICVEPCFFKELLTDANLTNAMKSGNGCILRNRISTNWYSFYRLVKFDTEKLMNLFRILQIPDTINSASFEPHRGIDSCNKIASLKALTSEELARFAREPGFMAYLTLAEDDMLNMRNFCTRIYKEFKMLNPFCIPAFYGFKTWFNYNRRSFIEFVDWRIVLAFYQVKLNDDPVWETVLEDTMYPASLEYIIRKYLHNVRPSFVFISDYWQTRFENEVWPVIDEVLNRRTAQVIDV